MDDRSFLGELIKVSLLVRLMIKVHDNVYTLDLPSSKKLGIRNLSYCWKARHELWDSLCGLALLNAVAS